MIDRRMVLAGGAGLFVLPRAVRAQDTRFSFAGSIKQGGLVIGRVAGAAAVAAGDQQVRVSPDGLFAFGFGRDETKAMTIRARFADGTTQTATLTPETREYDIQRIEGLPDKYVSPPQDVRDRIKRDSAAVGAARAHDSAMTFFAERIDWPVAGPISGVYGSQRILNGEARRPHFGVDIAAPEGADIVAPAGGIVRLADDLYFSGNTVVIDHGHGISTSYLHMSRLDIETGQPLARGQTIGAIGHTGRATGPHLCWRMNWFQERLDPALSAGPAPGSRA